MRVDLARACSASPRARMSRSLARASPQTVLSLIASAIACTASKSPSSRPGSRPRSRRRACARAGARCAASRRVVIDAPGLCSPSRMVVSKMINRSLAMPPSANARHAAADTVTSGIVIVPRDAEATGAGRL